MVVLGFRVIGSDIKKTWYSFLIPLEYSFLHPTQSENLAEYHVSQ
jgi:hypothetical protein